MFIQCSCLAHRIIFAVYCPSLAPSGVCSQSATRKSRPEDPSGILNSGIHKADAPILTARNLLYSRFATYSLPLQYGDALTEEQVMEVVKETDVLNEVR